MKRKTLLRRMFRWLAAVLLTPFVLLLLLAAALYVPPVQRWAVARATSYASELTGMEVGLKALHLSFPLDVELQRLVVSDGERRVVDVERAVADLDLTGIWALRLGVEAIELQRGEADTHALIPTMRLRGRIHSLLLRADEVDLLHGRVTLSEARLRGCDISVALMDTMVVDSTESAPLPWTVAVGDVEVSDTRLALHLPGDSLSLVAAVSRAAVSRGHLDLGEGTYRVRRFTLRADSLRYDLPHEPSAPEGLDPNHIALHDIRVDVENLLFRQADAHLSARLGALCLREQSGLEVTRGVANVLMDSSSIQLRGAEFETTNSRLTADVDLDFSALSPSHRGTLRADVRADVGHADVLLAAASVMPKELRRCYPEQPLQLSLSVEGNVDSLLVTEGRVGMPTVVDIRTTGHAIHLTDSLRLGADLAWDVKTMNLAFLRRYLDLPTIAFPPMTLTARTTLREANYAMLDAQAREGQGTVRLVGNLDLRRMAYDARLRVRSLQLHDFMPLDSLYHLTASASVRGVGTDMLSPHAQLEAQARIDRLEYAAWLLDSVDFSARLREGDGTLELNSDNELVRLQACADASIRERRLTASAFSLDMSRLDLYALGLSRDTLSASVVMHAEGSSDFDQTHHLSLSTSAMELVMRDTVFHPVDLQLASRFTPQDATLRCEAGDLSLSLTSQHALAEVTRRADLFLAELSRQADSLRLDQDTLRTLLPDVKVHFACGQRNPLHNILRSTVGYTFGSVSLDMGCDSLQGLSARGYVHRFNTGAVLLDTITLSVRQDASGVSLDAGVRNGPKNKVAVFDSRLHAALTPTGATAHLDFVDGQGKKGVDVGMQADMLPEGLRLHLSPLNPIIAYRRFTLNADNFVEMTRSGRLEALVNLLADDGTGLKLYSTPNPDAEQDLSLSVNHFNLGELSAVMPYMPLVEGFLGGDVHYMQADSTLTVSADIAVAGMKYEGTRLGDMALNAVYFPNADGSHYVDALVEKDGREIVALSGRYWEEDKQGRIDAQATLERMPFSLADAFIPAQIVRLEGYALGELTVTGTTAAPLLDGALATEGLHLIADAYNIRLTVPDDTLRVEANHIDLDRIEAYAAGQTPLVLDGSIDFRDLDQVSLDVRMQAKNYQLINAKRRPGTVAYGKVYVDVLGRLWGTQDDLKMRGRLNVLGATDVSYVLKDSPITVEDQLADIVTFCDFSDTLQADVPAGTTQSIDVQMNVTIEESAQVHCLLSDDGRDHIDLLGGGNLTLSYDLQNDLRLTGRYTIQQGLMRYSLMAIPLNDFQIREGSYVEFQGDLMNPRLNIAASERVKASVTEGDDTRNVSFNVGLALSQTLDDMGLEFTLEAPEDMTVQNQLSAMSAEERGRVAVTMLVTGMYMTSDSKMTGGFSYANTLNTYLQSVINNLAGQAFTSVDLNFGIENSTTDRGTTTTDYSFSFAKRFWGNRFRLVVGGKVSTGQDAVNTGQTLIDNVSLEYRLDKNSTRYVRLYYDRNYESLLEGELMDMGAGLVLRKKTETLGELFIFRNKKANDTRR